jgi:replication initiation protein RepC
MESVLPTTPFGRRSLTLAHIASQMTAKHRPADASANKWTVYNTICEAKLRLGLPDRSLTVLEALLTFHPDTVLTGADLIVYPSNERLALRAKGMAHTTMRRQLAILVDAGVIIRRDSPNGKRFARKTGGLISQAFGFDLAPIVARAAEFKMLAEEVAADRLAVKLAREQLTVLRRDIVKLIAAGLEEGVPIPATGQGPATWEAVHALYRTIAARIPRAGGAATEIEPIVEELTALAQHLLNILETHVKTIKMDSNERQCGRHIQTSNRNPSSELEPGLRKGRAAREEPNPQPSATTERSYPLGMVLKACPDLADYAKGGISSWRDFLAAATVVRPMLGISPSAWEEAQTVMGEAPAAVVVACILQRASAINSAGGYLRELTRKAEAGQFSLGPMLMALIGRENREKKRA